MSEKEKASASTLAEANIIQAKSYPISPAGASENLKEFLGVLLLRLASGQAKPSGWRFFEVLLRRHYGLKQLVRDSL